MGFDGCWAPQHLAVGGILLLVGSTELSCSTSPAPQQPHTIFPRRLGGIWLRLHFTPSPPLCGGGWWLSRGTYTDTPVLKDTSPCFYIYIKKKPHQWKKPKSDEGMQERGGSRGGWAVVEAGVSTHLSTAGGGQSPEHPPGSRVWGAGDARAGHPHGGHRHSLALPAGLGAPASTSPRGASDRRVARGLHSLSSAKREKKKGKKKIYILTVTHHLPFWNLWGWCNLHKAVQKSKTILNNRGGKKKFAADG